MDINRIILIGNGFDLAHNLKTSYNHFIDYLIENELIKISQDLEVLYKTTTQKMTKKVSGELISFNYKYSLVSTIIEDIALLNNPQLKPKEKLLKLKGRTKYSYNNSFYCSILEKHIQSWVDLEEEYFAALIGATDDTIIELNKHFELIKQKLSNYLLMEISPNCEKLEIDPKIDKIINSDIELEDLKVSFGVKHKKTILDLEYKLNQQEKSLQISQIVLNDLIQKKNESQTPSVSLNLLSDTTTMTRKIITKQEEVYNANLEIKSTVNRLASLKDLNLRKNILLINFNYTDTKKHYGFNKNNTIHIHGELAALDNPVIFGYGDERSDDYKNLELKNNNYLQHIKSFAYSNTSNYRKLMEYIDSKPFQIFIIGHSCGLSDRTLLSTLFEHENCISIKPFYYINENENYDSYQDVVMNISRNFTNKIKMRELVVNKTQTDTYSILKKLEV